jgi:hypothetical protein
MAIADTRITSNKNFLPRHLYRGPQRILATGYGISVDLPAGWVACIFRGEILSIEPNAQSDARMHLIVVDCAIDDAINLMTQGGDLGPVYLQPTTEFTVEGTTVTAQFAVHGDSRFTHAVATMVVTKGDKGIMYVAFSDSASQQSMLDVVRQFADSTRKIEQKSVDLSGSRSRPILNLAM